VIDTWAYDPVAVKTAVGALRGRIGHYVYVSSAAVYNVDKGSAPYSESTPVLDPEETDRQYSKDKVGGERAVSESGVTTTFLRAGIILGPYEDVWRLPWWLLRMKKGGPTLAPGPKSTALQFIDARDLASFAIDAAEKKIAGPFNLVSEIDHISFSDFLKTANSVTGDHAELCWLERETVLEAGIQQEPELPLWFTAPRHYVYQIDVSKAIKAGLKIRSAKDTITDAWKWAKTVDQVPSMGLRIGLDPDKEKEALKKYYKSEP